MKGVRANGAQTQLGLMIKFNDRSGIRTGRAPLERALDISDRKRCVPCASAFVSRDSLGLAKV